MTDESNTNPMTHDGLSSVDRLYARAQSTETQATRRSVIDNPQRRFNHSHTEPADIDHCTRCGQPILQAHTDGLPIHANPTPLDPTAEILALLTGHATYDLLPRVGGTVELRWRHLDVIRANTGCTVVADHRCPPGPRLTRAQIRALPPAVRLSTRPARHPEDNHDRPPF